MELDHDLRRGDDLAFFRPMSSNQEMMELDPDLRRGDDPALCRPMSGNQEMMELDPDLRRGDELWPYFVQHNSGNESLHTA